MYLHAITNIFSAEGRINRKQYLAVLSIAILITTLFVVMTKNSQVVVFIAQLLLIPTKIKRLHDINMSGWMVLIGLIPVLSAILSFCLLIFSGSKEENKYGVPPHLQKLDKEN